MHPSVIRLKKSFEDYPDEEKLLFNCGVTNKDIELFDEKLKEWKMPKPSEAFYDLYRTYNGSVREETFDDGDCLISLLDIIHTKEAFDGNLDGGSYDNFKKGSWWNKKWLPFLEQPFWALTVIDFEGSYGGKKGQIISFDYKSMEDRVIVHASFDKWLETIVNIKEKGLWHNRIGKHEDEDFYSYVVDFSEEQIEEREQIYKSINQRYGIRIPMLNYYIGN